MTEVARMRFESAKSPEQKGELVLTSDGELIIQPSEEFAGELARLEEAAVERSRSVGVGIGVALIALGAVWALAGWAAGRRSGRLRDTLSEPRPLDQVKMFADPEGGVHLLVPGHGQQKIEMNWEAGETDAKEVLAFLDAYRKLKGIGHGCAGRCEPQESPAP